MTCIIGSTRFICADRRIAEDGGAVSSMVKVAKNQWLIAAAAGLTTATLAVKRAVRAGAQSPSDLLAAVDKNSCALVLSWDGILSHISEGVIWPVTDKIVAIGSGADLAIGWLTASCTDAVWGFDSDRADDFKLRAAQRFVAKRRADCGSGCDIRSFE